MFLCCQQYIQWKAYQCFFFPLLPLPSEFSQGEIKLWNIKLIIWRYSRYYGHVECEQLQHKCICLVLNWYMLLLLFHVTVVQ